MTIWFRQFTLEEIQQYSRGSMTEHLDLRFTEIGPDYLSFLPAYTGLTTPPGFDSHAPRMLVLGTVEKKLALLMITSSSTVGWSVSV